MPEVIPAVRVQNATGVGCCVPAVAVAVMSAIQTHIATPRCKRIADTAFAGCL